MEKLTNGDGEEELKRQSIDKVNSTKEGNLNCADLGFVTVLTIFPSG